ncbi:MAG: glycosyltransferase family 4 protein [Candidatus Cloacimonetes bacterium]|nr:glycosyltransferase family 4 protein [Candidatus Cloacimonadota bacterium]
MTAFIKNRETSEKNTIKILLVLPFFHPHPGGSQKYAEELFVHLKKAHPEIEIDVLCYNTDQAAGYEEYRGLKIYRVPCFNILSGKFTLPRPVSLVKKLYQLSKNKYNFVNTHIRFFDTCWWVWAYAKIIKAESIFTGHCASHPNHQNPMVRLIAKLVDLTIAKFSLRFYNIITVTNECAANFFAKTLRVKPNQIIYGSVDTNIFKPQQNLPKRKIPKTNLILGPNDILITYVGRLIWSKGVSIFYEVAKDILNRFPEKVFFVIAGPGELQDKLAKYIVENNLSQKIFLTGSLNSGEVQGLLGISNIFVYPSFHSEGFPQAILEAGASGCLVIATDTGGTKEVVKNKETGLLIFPKNKTALKKKIVWAIENPKQTKTISQNMRRLLIKGFDGEIQSERFFSLTHRLNQP